VRLPPPYAAAPGAAACIDVLIVSIDVDKVAIPSVIAVAVAAPFATVSIDFEFLVAALLIAVTIFFDDLLVLLIAVLISYRVVDRSDK
jgi:hypothetical protein